MPVYLSPGVYVEEVPSAQQPIAGVGTNTVGFIGLVPDEIQYPVPNDEYDPQLAREALQRPEVDKEVKEQEDRQTKIQADIAGLETQLAEPTLSPGDKRRLERERDRKRRDLEPVQTELKRLQELKAKKPDEKFLKPYVLPLATFKVVAEPRDAKLCTNFTEYTERFGSFSADDPSKDPGTAMYPEHRALTHAVSGFFKNGGTRCFVTRIKSVTDLDKALSEFESIDEIAIVATPGLNGKDVWGKLAAHCMEMKDRFAILDSPAEVETDSELNVRLLNYSNTDNVLPDRDKNAAFYFPWIEVIDPAKQLQDEDPAREILPKHRGKVYVPPSGHVAGIYARVDEERGVHKAPGNEAVIGALDVKYYIGSRKQDLLNPQGVNCIRNLNGSIRVYGARTIGGDKNGEWKYINVRRVFLFLRESIDEGTQWVVFEPNDRALWGKIRRNVGAFLTNVWRDGALFGATPQEAFYVKCDEETNPPEVRDLGQVITEIGVSIVRPAEFVIFRVTQWAGPKGTTG